MIQRCSFCSQASGDSWYEAQKVWLVQKEGFTLGEWVQLCVWGSLFSCLSYHQFSAS